MPRFTDMEIERIFGADDAENEEKDRFLSYFFRNRAYESLIEPLPIRLLIGHKGVGKSALLKRAFYTDLGSNQFSIWMQPGELTNLKETLPKASTPSNHIENWKLYLLQFAWRRFVEDNYGSEALPSVPETEVAGYRSLLRLLTAGTEARGISQIHIFIDDIDRAWSASADDIRDISALLNAIRDIASPAVTPKISFRIGLRSDVYYLVRTSDESTDKIERNTIWLKWDNNGILRVMAKRIQTYFGEGFDENSPLTQKQINDVILSKVIDPIFRGRGKWEEKPTYNVLLSLTRARPRDLVKLIRGAAKRAQAESNQIISSKNLQDSFESYSQERLQDIINEYRSEMLAIDRLLFGLRPTTRERQTASTFQFTNDILNQKLANIMQMHNLTFTNGKRVTPRSLVQFLYKIDFITARLQLQDGSIQRHYFDESRFLANENSDFGYAWEIHPAYRWALQPQDVGGILDSLF